MGGGSGEGDLHATPLVELPEKILRKAVSKSVHEKLGTLTRELFEFTKGMNEHDSALSKHMLVELIGKAAEDFVSKMKHRIDKKGQSE